MKVVEDIEIRNSVRKGYKRDTTGKGAMIEPVDEKRLQYRLKMDGKWLPWKDIQDVLAPPVSG